MTKVIFNYWHPLQCIHNITFDIVKILAALFVFQAGNQFINNIIFVVKVFQFMAETILILIVFLFVVASAV